MQNSLPMHDEDTAPEAARARLAAVRGEFGVIPNLERVMANAPALLASYSTAWELFEQTSLSPIERQVVYQTANFENDCAYCVPWHTFLSQKADMPNEDIEALRSGAPLSDPKLEALRAFARELIHNRGKVTPAELNAFIDAGYDMRSALDVILGLAIKVMSNYTNSIAGTPLDKAVATFSWEKPKIAMRQS